MDGGGGLPGVDLIGGGRRGRSFTLEGLDRKTEKSSFLHLLQKFESNPNTSTFFIFSLRVEAQGKFNITRLKPHHTFFTCPHETGRLMDDLLYWRDMKDK